MRSDPGLSDVIRRGIARTLQPDILYPPRSENEESRMETLLIPQSLAKKLARVSAREGRTASRLACQAIRERIDYLEGRLKAIDAGFADLERRGGAPTTEVLASLDAIIARHGGCEK